MNMSRQTPNNPSRHKFLENATAIYSQEELMAFKPKWYFTKEEIKDHSPSRKDGIDHEHESHLRQLYCSYLQELGIELKVPQLTIASAIMICHRFYMRQSHAKNHWQTVATACMFLACKAEDTPRLLKDLTVVAYKLMYSWDPLAPQRIREREVYDRQKELIVLGERLILSTIAFDLNIEHPYKPLVAALKRLDISEKGVVKVAWNFVNDWLRTTLCLQYKPHYIAAGSLFIAAKLEKFKLPSANGNAWWLQFEVSPKQVREVINHMLQLLGQGGKQAVPVSSEVKNEFEPVAKKRKSDSSDLYIPNGGSMVAQDSSNYSTAMTRTISKCAVVEGNQKQPIVGSSHALQTSKNCLTDSGSGNSVVEDGDGEPITGDSIQRSGCKIVPVKESSQKIDVTRIRERLKRRKLDRVENKNPSNDLEDDTNGEAWIEREIERGIELVSAVS